MGRFYSIPINRVAVTAIQDLWEILAGAGKPFYLHEIRLAQSTDYGDAQAEGLALEIKRALTGYTSGSGGSSPTIQKHATNDAACGATAEINNTVQAATNGGGTVTAIQADGFNAQAGYQYLPPPEQRILFLATEACIISLEGASGTAGPVDSITISGNVVIEEL